MKVGMLAAMCLMLLIAGALGSFNNKYEEELLREEAQRETGSTGAEHKLDGASSSSYTPPTDVNAASIVDPVQRPEGFPELTTAPNIDEENLSGLSEHQKPVNPDPKQPWTLHEDANLQQAQREVANHILSKTGNEALAKASFDVTSMVEDARRIRQYGHDITSAAQNIGVEHGRKNINRNIQEDAYGNLPSKIHSMHGSADIDRQYYQEYAQEARRQGKPLSLDDAYAYSQEKTNAHKRVGGDAQHGTGEGSPWTIDDVDYKDTQPNALWQKKANKDIYQRLLEEVQPESIARRRKIGVAVAAILGLSLVGGYVGNSLSIGKWNPADSNWWTHKHSNASRHRQ